MTDDFDSPVADSSNESFDSEPEPMPDISDAPEPEPESEPDSLPESESTTEIPLETEPSLMDESEHLPEPQPEIDPAIENPPEPKSSLKVESELLSEPQTEIEPTIEIQSEPSLMDEAESLPEPQFEPDLIDNSDPVFERQRGLEPIQPEPMPELVEKPESFFESQYAGMEAAMEETQPEPKPELSYENQPETRSVHENGTDPFPEYMENPGLIPEDNVQLFHQQSDVSAAVPEIISEQDGLTEEGSLEKQSSTGSVPEAAIASTVQSAGVYSQTGTQVDAEQEDINKFVQDLEKQGLSPEQYLEQKRTDYAALDSDVLPQTQDNTTSPSQRYKTDYSEVELGKAAREINGENADINKFLDDLDKQGITPEQYVEQKRAEYAALDKGAPMPDTSSVVTEVVSAQEGIGDAMPPIPPDTNIIKDAQERDITIRRWGDDGLIQLRAYDSSISDVPENPNLGTAGMANLNIESESDGPTKVRLQDIVIPPDYRKSGIAGNMLDQTVDIAKAKGASEVYGTIENEEALGYWKHMEEKGTGWKVDPSEGTYGYVRYDLSKPQQAQYLLSENPPADSSSYKRKIDKNVRLNDNENVINPPDFYPRFKTKEELDTYYENTIKRYGDKPNTAKFLEYLNANDVQLKDLVEEEIDGGKNYSRYLTKVASLAKDAGLDSQQVGNVVHRMGELHTLHAYPEEIINGTRLVEQEIAGREIDRIKIRGDQHFIKDIKAIHLNDYEATPEGEKWVSYMAQRFGDGFREKIERGELLPITTKMEASMKNSLRQFMKSDVKQYKSQLENYRQIYADAKNLSVSKVKSDVQPYFVFRR